jgi:hypothetical protein
LGIKVAIVDEDVGVVGEVLAQINGRALYLLA